MMLEPDAFATKWGSLAAVFFSGLEKLLQAIGHEMEILYVPMWMGLIVGAGGFYFQKRRDKREAEKLALLVKKAADEHEAHVNAEKRKSQLHAVEIRKLQGQCD